MPLREVFKARTETYCDVLSTAHLQSRYQRGLQSIAALMYKVKNGQAPSYIKEIFDSRAKGYNLRNTDFSIPRFNSVHYSVESISAFFRTVTFRAN